MRVVSLLMVWCLSVVTVAAQAPPSPATRIDELRERIDARAYDDAEALAAALREDAAQAGDDDTVALTMRLLGGMRIDQERLAEARTQLVAAQEFARSRGLRRRELEATLILSRVGAIDGDAERAEVDAMAALGELVALDLPREATLWAFNQALASVRGMDGDDALLARAKPYLRADDRFGVACRLWHAFGDHYFNKAAYVDAHDWNQFLEIQEQLLFGVTGAVGAAGAEVAFPSQTMYMADDPRRGIAPEPRTEQK
jgi:hypothetical protein